MQARGRGFAGGSRARAMALVALAVGSLLLPGAAACTPPPCPPTGKGTSLFAPEEPFPPSAVVIRIRPGQTEIWRFPVTNSFNRSANLTIGSSGGSACTPPRANVEPSPARLRLASGESATVTLTISTSDSAGGFRELHEVTVWAIPDQIPGAAPIEPDRLPCGGTTGSTVTRLTGVEIGVDVERTPLLLVALLGIPLAVIATAVGLLQVRRRRRALAARTPPTPPPSSIPDDQTGIPPAQP